MARSAATVLTSIGLLLASPATRAMEFTFDSSKAWPNKGSIVAVGEIQPGDDEKLQRFVAGLPGNTVLIGIALSSPSGDLLEGVRLATTIHNTRLATAAVDVCASACFLMFAAGTRKVVSEDARIGVHSVSYRGAEITESQRAVATMMARKAVEFDVPVAIVEKIKTTPADDMVWLTQDDLHSMNVELVNMRAAGYEPRPPLWFDGTKAGNSNASPALPTAIGPKKVEFVSDLPFSNTNPIFLAGRQARSDYETWFNGLSGELRTGAEWWAGVRARARREHLTCEAEMPLWATGCKQAQAVLRPSDDRRRAEPDFRAGWNSF